MGTGRGRWAENMGRASGGPRTGQAKLGRLRWFGFRLADGNFAAKGNASLVWLTDPGPQA